MNKTEFDRVGLELKAGTMQRAYSKFEVKAIDEQKRIISGIATTPNPDRMGDIVESMGAEFELPLPFLWQHDSMQPVGEVISAKMSKTAITVDVQIAQIDKPGKLFDRLEEAWDSIKIKLVRGLSIGFAPIEYSIIEESWSYHFIKWAWLELSAVTIPANADASISAIKRYDAKTLALRGHKQFCGVPLIAQSSPGAPGDKAFKGIQLNRGNPKLQETGSK